MWTLLNQKPRDYMRANHLEDAIKDYKKLVLKHKISYREVIETAKLLELERQNDLYVYNWDVFDEQMAWFWDILITLTNNEN